MYTSTFDKLEGHGVPPIIEYTAAYICMLCRKEHIYTITYVDKPG